MGLGMQGMVMGIKPKLRTRNFEFDGNEVCKMLAQKLLDDGQLEPWEFLLAD